MTDERAYDSADPAELGAAIEAVVGACGSVAIGELAELLERDVAEVEAQIAASQATPARGVRVRVRDGFAVFEVVPEYAALARRALGVADRRLSRAALEALAVVAYLQPVTRAQVSEVRGVVSDGVVRTLLERGLIEEVPSSDPVAFRTTTAFLVRAGLGSIEELPPLGRYVPSAAEVADLETEVRGQS